MSHAEKGRLLMQRAQRRLLRMENQQKQTIRDHKELKIYQKAFDAAMEIFHLSKKFPVEERYSLTDQIRRSSRSDC